MGKASILYGDMAVNAHNLFTASSIHVQYTLDMANLVRAEPRRSPRVATVAEDSMMVLNNGWEFAAETLIPPPNTSWAYIGDEMSDENGEFLYPVSLGFASNDPVTSPGLTITFDEVGNGWATYIRVEWKRAGARVDLQYYSPDRPVYFIDNPVENYDEVALTMLSWSLPYRLPKVNNVQFGRGVVIDRLLNVSVRQEVSPVSAALAINTLEFTTSVQPGQKFGFQRGQNVKCFFDDLLVGSFFIQSIEQPSQYNYTVRANCWLSLLDSVDHPGGIYTAASARTLAEEVCALAKASLSFEADDMAVTGWLPYATCRENLAQVCFACGYICDTSFSDVIRIFPQPTEVQHILTNNDILMKGTKISEVETPRSVSLASHSFARGTPSSDSTEIFSAAKTGSTGQITVVFDAAYSDLFIENGTILSSGDNYAHIQAGINCVLYGTPYVDTKIYNGITTSGDSTKKALSVDAPSLISSSNALARLSSLYTYYSNPFSATFKTTNRDIRCGDLVGAIDTYMGALLGIVEKMEFKLNGSKLFPTITISSKTSNVLEGYPRAGELFAGEDGLW